MKLLKWLLGSRSKTQIEHNTILSMLWSFGAIVHTEKSWYAYMPFLMGSVGDPKMGRLRAISTENYGTVNQLRDFKIFIPYQMAPKRKEIIMTWLRTYGKPHVKFHGPPLYHMDVWFEFDNKNKRIIKVHKMDKLPADLKDFIATERNGNS